MPTVLHEPRGIGDTRATAPTIEHVPDNTDTVQVRLRLPSLDEHERCRRCDIFMNDTMQALATEHRIVTLNNEQSEELEHAIQQGASYTIVYNGYDYCPHMYEILSVEKPTHDAKQLAVTIELQRHNGNTKLSFTVAPKLEQVFAKLADGQRIRTSERWQGLQFYVLPDAISKSQRYQQLLESLELYDNYGQPILNGSGRFNVAWLRTRGGTGSIELPPTLPFAVLTNVVQNISKFIRDFYREQVKDQSIKTTITLEA